MLAVGLVIWGLTDVRSRGRVDPDRPGVHRTDFTVYTEAGAAFFDGRDPYAVTNPRGWGYLYPPLLAILVAPLHVLDPQLQVLTWFFLNLFVGWGCCRESIRLTNWLLAHREGHVPQLPRWLVIATITTVALPALNCLQRGQVGLIKTYLLLLGLRLLLESRSWRKAFAAGCVFSAAIALKITPALPIGLLVAEQIVSALRERAWGRLPRDQWHARRSLAAQRACGVGLGTVWGLVVCLLIIPAALIGAERNALSLDRWWNLVATKAPDAGYDLFAGNSYSMQNQSLLNAARHLGNWVAYEFAGGSNDRLRVSDGGAPHVMDAPRVGQMLLALRLAIVALAAWLAWRCGRRGDPLTTAAAFGLACVAALIVSPISRAHYFVLLLPAVLWVPLWLERAGQARLARWAAWAPATLVVSHYIAASLVGRIGLLGIGTTVWFVVSASVMLVLERRRETWPERGVIHSFRVGPPAPDSAGSLQVDDRTVTSLRLGALLPNLAHHERNG